MHKQKSLICHVEIVTKGSKGFPAEWRKDLYTCVWLGVVQRGTTLA